MLVVEDVIDEDALGLGRQLDRVYPDALVLASGPRPAAENGHYRAVHHLVVVGIILTKALELRVEALIG